LNLSGEGSGCHGKLPKKGVYQHSGWKRGIACQK
jgi:hypothetical protein